MSETQAQPAPVEAPGAPITLADRRMGALLGMFIGDALAMPVHWYYDIALLLRDYGYVQHYLPPKNPHPESILHRSHYKPLNDRGQILHDQAQYWGQRGIHYHQFLEAGENTLNLKLATLMLESLAERGAYDTDDYLKRYLRFFLVPGTHRDTYIEQAHREFFIRYAAGKDPLGCASDDNHVGALTPVPIFAAVFCDSREHAAESAIAHVGLTHNNDEVFAAAGIVVDLLMRVIAGDDLISAIAEARADPRRPWAPAEYPFEKWWELPDEEVIGIHLNPACYISDALASILYLAWKYWDNAEAALCLNTNLGGDNCGRGAVLGAIVGASLGRQGLPERWVAGLKSRERVESLARRIFEG